MDPLLLLLLLAPLVIGVVCSSKSSEAGAVVSSAKTSKEEAATEEYVPKVEEPAARLQELPIETIEGIGSVFGGKLRKAGIATVQDLLTAGTIQVARICGVSQETATRWQAMSRF